MLRFYGGGSRERDILTRAYLRLIKHVNSIYKVRIPSFFLFFISPSFLPPFLDLLTACSLRSGLHTNGQKTMLSSIYVRQLAMRSLLFPFCSRGLSGRWAYRRGGGGVRIGLMILLLGGRKVCFCFVLFLVMSIGRAWWSARS